MVETFREHMAPAFVDRLDAWELAERAGMPLPPVMIYGDDVSHVLTEEGIANLLLCILLLWAMFRHRRHGRAAQRRPRAAGG
ncbi:hypothetical protein G6F40_016941 [Rhizopus arrhizus]|nr:hypothetical protein G6F40_016941 [Rhizopus arrhizus]